MATWYQAILHRMIATLTPAPLTMAPKKKSSKRTKAPFDLMRLTPELRNMVYCAALTAPNEIYVSEASTQPPASIFWTQPPPVKHLKVTTFVVVGKKKICKRWHTYGKHHNIHLLRASKQIHAEATGFLYYHNHFVLKTASTAKRFALAVHANLNLLSTLSIGTCHLDRDWRMLDMLKPASRLQALHITITGGTGHTLQSLVDALLFFTRFFLLFKHGTNDDDGECPSRRKTDCVCDPDVQKARLNVMSFNLFKDRNGVDFGPGVGVLKRLTPEIQRRLKLTVMRHFERQVSIKTTRRKIEVLQDEIVGEMQKGVKLLME